MLRMECVVTGVCSRRIVGVGMRRNGVRLSRVILTRVRPSRVGLSHLRVSRVRVSDAGISHVRARPSRAFGRLRLSCTSRLVRPPWLRLGSARSSGVCLRRVRRDVVGHIVFTRSTRLGRLYLRRCG